jgi:hypothetical protein
MIGNQFIIHRYTRERAIEEGTLIDATNLAHEMGFKYPVAVTAAAYAQAIAVPDGIVRQDSKGRLWDVLQMLLSAIRRGESGGMDVPFTVHTRAANHPSSVQAIQLRAVCAPGDRGEPCITIMLPGEN